MLKNTKKTGKSIITLDTLAKKAILMQSNYLKKNKQTLIQPVSTIADY